MFKLLMHDIKKLFHFFLLKKKNKINSISRNKERNECIVIGNGPSLNQSLVNNLLFFNNKELIVVNDFSLSDHYTKLKPSNYVIIDPAYWNFDLLLDSKKIALQNIRNNTDWNLNLILPIEAKKTMQHYFQENYFINILYFPNVYIRTNRFENLKYHFFKNYFVNPLVQNVLVYSLFHAINLKFKRIYLTGSEHSWLKTLVVNNENDVCSVDNHFYSINNESKPFLTCFGEKYKLHELLNDFSKMFYGYYEISKYAKYCNCEIINLCEESYIDSFKKMNLKSL
jgi:hypothetical protein